MILQQQIPLCGQAQRVVLHHAWLDFVGERKPDRGRQIFTAYFLFASRRLNNPLKIDERFMRRPDEVGNRNLADLRFRRFQLPVQQLFGPLGLLVSYP